MANGVDMGSGPPGGGSSMPETRSEGYSAFKLEQRGIELIPDADRAMRPTGLFWMWAGAIWNVEFLVYGALIVSFGLSFWQAVVAILVGNLVYAFLGWASLPGPETGTTAFMVSRAAFGRNGNRAPSLFNWITQVGFEVEGIVLVVLIVVAMFSHEGVSLNDRRQDDRDHPRGRRAVRRAVPRARHDHQGAAIPGLRVHRGLRHHGEPGHSARSPDAAFTSTRRGGSGRRASCSSSRRVVSAGPRTPPTTRATSRETPPRRRRSGPRRSVGPSRRSCSSSLAPRPTS